MLLPTFFVIGAAKAGTTSLNSYLAAHPAIAMAEPKESHLMIWPDWRDRVRRYADLFPREAAVRGDCSTGYSVYPLNPEASDHIAELVPEARLIYLVRDPIERAIAHYAQGVLRRGEDRPIERALSPDDPESQYVAASRYGTQVEVYLRRFAEERLLVIDHEDLRADRRATLRRVFAHVGADPGFWDYSFAAEYNVRASDNVQLGRLGARLRDSALNRVSRRLLPRPARAGLVSATRRVLGRELRPEVSPELRRRLAESLAPEAERLRELTGQRFAGWSV